MKTQIQSLAHLKLLVEYIIWSYDQNVSNLADKNINVIVVDMNSTWLVKINYLAGIEKGYDGYDPATCKDDKEIHDNCQFNLLKTEGFKQITKYVEEICEQIAKIDINA